MKLAFTSIASRTRSGCWRAGSKRRPRSLHRDELEDLAGLAAERVAAVGQQVELAVGVFAHRDDVGAELCRLDERQILQRPRAGLPISRPCRDKRSRR